MCFVSNVIFRCTMACVSNKTNKHRCTIQFKNRWKSLHHRDFSFKLDEHRFTGVLFEIDEHCFIVVRFHSTSKNAVVLSVCSFKADEHNCNAVFFRSRSVTVVLLLGFFIQNQWTSIEIIQNLKITAQSYWKSLKITAQTHCSEVLVSATLSSVLLLPCSALLRAWMCTGSQ